MSEARDFIKGMNRNRKAWERLTAATRSNPGHVETVAEYIRRTGCRTETRTSKKGVNLTTVFYEGGPVREYETSRLDTTSAL